MTGVSRYVIKINSDKFYRRPRTEALRLYTNNSDKFYRRPRTEALRLYTNIMTKTSIDKTLIKPLVNRLLLAK
jgi:hypothetical protein